MNLIKNIYKYVVRTFLVLSITILGIGLFVYAFGYNDLCINILELGYWILFIIPLIPVITLYIEAIYNKDIETILVISIILSILTVNIYFIGFHSLPFIK